MTAAAAGPAARRSRPPAFARVLTRVTASVRAHDEVAAGDLVLACVSGGADSVCLLESLIALRRLLKIRVAVFHFDHRLREGSAADAGYVRRLASSHALEFHLRAAAAGPARGESVEAWAHAQRAAAAAEVADLIGANRIAEGHTLDDQAETVLIALVRGGGLEALSGIAPVRGREIQPLLDVTRVEVEAACRSLRLRPRSDPTNDDTSLLRNAIRRHGLPALEAATGRELRATFARTADHLRADERELSALAELAAGDVITSASAGPCLGAGTLAGLTPAIAGRVVRLALYDLGIVPTRADVDAVLDLAAGRAGRRRDLTGGATARRTATRVELARRAD